MEVLKSLNKVVIFCAGLMGAGGEERLLWEEEKFFSLYYSSTSKGFITFNHGILLKSPFSV